MDWTSYIYTVWTRVITDVVFDSGAELNANTSYFVFMQNTGAVELSLTEFSNTSDKDNENSESSSGWSIANTYRWSDDGSTWNDITDVKYINLYAEETTTLTTTSTSAGAAKNTCSVDDNPKLLHDTVWTSANGDIDFIVTVTTSTIDTTGMNGLQSNPYWAQPAGLFDEQPQLVELLATIAALALPLGALGAVVFFGNTISVATGTSGFSSQIIAVITIVVVILVIVEVFGQFIVYLDQAFDVIDKDRFAVYGYVG